MSLLTLPYATEFLGLALVHFLAVVAPGPDFAVIVNQSVRHGRRLAFFTALGIGCGLSLHISYTLLGVGALVHGFPVFLQIARFLGSAYLIYLALKLLRAQPSANALMDAGAPQTKAPSVWGAFFLGFLTNATNPKATLFFLAVFSSLVSQSTPISVQVFYGVWMCFVNTFWFTLVGFLFSQQHVRAKFIRMGHWFERLMGIVLLIFAIRLWL